MGGACGRGHKASAFHATQTVPDRPTEITKEELRRRKKLAPMKVNITRVDSQTQLKITVQPWEEIEKSVLRELKVDQVNQEAVVTLGNIRALPGETWEDAGIETDACVGVSLTEKSPWAVWESIAIEICTLNPSVKHEVLLKSAKMSDENESIAELNLIGLQQLPDSFSAIIVQGDIILSSSRLTSLPNSFGQLHVHGSLDISRNRLQVQSRDRLKLSNMD